MTFKEFQASKREASAAEIEHTGYNVCPNTSNGYLYHGNLVVEITKDWKIPVPVKAYYLLIENMEHESDDLRDLEVELYKYAISSDWINGTCAYCSRSLESGGDVQVSDQGNVFCTSCVADEVRKEKTTVFGLFERHLGEAPADETLLELEADTACGRDCARVITTAAAFAQACDPCMRESIIRLTEAAIGVYWRG